MKGCFYYPRYFRVRSGRRRVKGKISFLEPVLNGTRSLTRVDVDSFKNIVWTLHLYSEKYFYFFDPEFLN